tara:strand:+ start:239 stop:979 length:741 start_codon:yes stop_codon:yes gene_type:complete
MSIKDHLIFFLLILFNKKIGYNLKNRLLFYFICLKVNKEKVETVKLKNLLISNVDIDKHPIKVSFLPYNVIDRYWDEHQLNVKNEIHKGNFKDDGTYPLITISKDNVVINGHHRVISLKEKYGEEHQLRIKRIDMVWYKVVWVKIHLHILRVDKNYKLDLELKFKDIFKSIPTINKNFIPKDDIKIEPKVMRRIMDNFEGYEYKNNRLIDVPNNLSNPIKPEHLITYIDKWNTLCPPNYRIIYHKK